jgi:hypothetical protein
VLKQWNVQLRAANSKSGSSLKHMYAQCVILVSKVNDQVSRAKGTRTQHTAASVPRTVHSNSGGTPTVRNYICGLPQSRPSNTVIAICGAISSFVHEAGCPNTQYTRSGETLLDLEQKVATTSWKRLLKSPSAIFNAHFTYPKQRIVKKVLFPWKVPPRQNEA